METLSSSSTISESSRGSLNQSVDSLYKREIHFALFTYGYFEIRYRCSSRRRTFPRTASNSVVKSYRRLGHYSSTRTSCLALESNVYYFSGFLHCKFDANAGYASLGRSTNGLRNIRVTRTARELKNLDVHLRETNGMRNKK